MINFTDKNYINTVEKLEALDQYLLDAEGNPKFNLMAFDTETNGLYFFRNVVIGFSLAVNAKEGYYVPLLEWVPDPTSLKKRKIKKVEYQSYMRGHFKCAWTGQTYPEFVTPNEYQPPDFIKMFLERWTSGIQLLMHNAPFDCNMVNYNFGVDLAPALFCDTQLLKHVIDENTRKGLKETASLWKTELGFDADEDAAAEQREMGESVIINGGTFNKSTKHVWRADPFMGAKYAAADAALTYGVFEVGMKKLEKKFTPKHFDWFFEEEVMPLCREVVIPMRYLGVFIDVDYFKKLADDTKRAMNKLEDEAIAKMGKLLDDCPKGLTLDKAVSQKSFIEKVMELEGLDIPTVTNKKGETKKTLGKPAIKKLYQQNPHWVYGYLLGVDELKYSEAEVKDIKLAMYEEITGSRHQFNISSDYHLRWLFFTKLGLDGSYKNFPQTDSGTPDKPVPSMAAEVLKEKFLGKYDFIRPILKYKKLLKLLSSYIEPALELNNKGWLHMDMNQSGTISGRFSCSGGFNLQTLPKVEELDRCPKCESKKVKIHKEIDLLADLTCEACSYHEEGILCPSAIKAGFVAPPGMKIINADYSSLEPRCFAFMSGDAKLKDIYKRNLDIYSKVYCDMLDKENRYSPDPNSPNFLKKKNKAARDKFKPIVLGIPYGARPPQVANLMNLKITKRVTDYETGLKVEKEMLDIERGREYWELYLQTYPDLKKYMEACELEACTKGFVETIVGRRRHFLYTRFVYRLISECGVSVEEFIDASNRTLENPSCLDDRLNQEALRVFCIKYNLEEWEIREKGYWSYVRAVFRNELNNAKNIKIQGLAAHITNRGMLDTTRYFRKYGISGYCCLQVHDEITSYAPIEQAEEAKKWQKIGMEKNKYTALLDIPMAADPLICDNLKDSK